MGKQAPMYRILMISVANSIHKYATYILGKRPCRPKWRVMGDYPGHYVIAFVHLHVLLLHSLSFVDKSMSTLQQCL